MGAVGAEHGQPTLKDVAARAGVSPMTASRTLSGGQNVRASLQERVFKAVEELGYRRNENARSIRPGQPSGLVGVAVANLDNPYYGSFAVGVEDVAARYGRRILLGNTGEQPDRERQLIADFVGRQVEGLVVVPSGVTPEHLHGTAVRWIPVVLASRSVPGVDTDRVLLDDSGGAYRATRALLDQGHERIAFLGNPLSVFTGQRRFEGFCAAMREAGVEVDEAYVRRAQQDVEAARLAMQELLEFDRPPTAVFAANNRNAVGALREIGARIRRGVDATSLPSIASFDNFELAELMPVPVTIVDHDATELGRAAGRMLFERLEGDESPPRTIELPVRVHPA
jgi:LacI family transcriptional regulator